MTKTVKKAAIAVLACAFVSSIAIATGAQTSAYAQEVTDAQIVAALKPIRDTEFGKTVGELIKIDGKVYQNYELGYVYAELMTDGNVQNKRDFGGKNVSVEDGAVKEEYLTDKMESWIKGRPADIGVSSLWATLASKFESEVTYNLEYALGKIYDEYSALIEEGYNPGIPTDNLSIWDEAVIKLDFYDGDCEFGFDGENRVHVTTIAYSFLEDKAFQISGEIFNFYKEAKAGSLSEPISDPFEYELNGQDGLVQAFALGYIFVPESGSIIVRAGARWDKDEEKFVPIIAEYSDITQTELLDVNLSDNQNYGGKGYTVEMVKNLFWEKYLSLIDEGYNPGLPDAEGIFYWDGLLVKQAYVGSDGVGNAWGRTNMMLILNPDDGKVYKVDGEILNIVDDSSQGLGKAEYLGYPLGDEKSEVINGNTYYYQEFSKGTIYSIEHEPQLTRFLKGKTFNDVRTGNTVKPNNPLFNEGMNLGCSGSVGDTSLCLIGAAVIILAVKLAFSKKSKNTKVKGE